MNIKDFKIMLEKLYFTQEEFLQKKYNRSLPFQDGLFDRWERAKRLGFEENVSIYNSTLVFGDVKVGRETWIGPYVILDGSGGKIKIGSYCSISAAVHIYTHDSVYWALSGGKKEFHNASVSVGDNTYIGAHSIIKAGVTIGSHCVIGANSFINKDFDDYSVIVGTPAKQIGKVLKENDKINIQYFENVY